MAAKHMRLHEPSEVRRSKKSEAREIILQFLIPILIPCLIAVGLRIWVVGVNEIPSASMENTLIGGEPGLSNDHIFTSKLTPAIFSLKRGQIVTFDDPGEWLTQSDIESSGSDLLIKRVIGLPGDHLQCAGGNASIVVNGQPVNESSYIKVGSEPCSVPFDVTVPAGHIWVMGDNRQDSADSLWHYANPIQGGAPFVPISNVQGVAKVIYWPISRWRSLGDGMDAFKDVPNP